MSDTREKPSIQTLRMTVAGDPVLSNQFSITLPCDRGDVEGAIGALKAKAKQTYASFRGANGKPTPAAQAATKALEMLRLL